MLEILVSLCLFPAAELSDFGREYVMEVRQQQELLLLEVERSVAKSISEEESRKFSFNSSSSSNITRDSFLTAQPTIQGGEASDSLSRARRKYVKGMMKHAWDGYSAHAWGKNEVRPVSKSGNSGSIFGASDTGATIVDSMDTLFIMGMEEEFARGKQWIAANLDLTQIKEEVNVFEINIRYVGGLLSLFALTGDEMFKDKAVEIVEKLLPAFDTPTGIPHGKVNMQTGTSRERKMSILSEFGTLHMEFSYLSDITGNTRYKEKVEAIRNFLYKKKLPKNLYPNFLHPLTGHWGQDHSSVGALGDSFYEYLLKEWLRSGKADRLSKKMFDEAVFGIEQNLLQYSSHGQTYLADWRGGKLDHKMDHLACFAGGMFGLAASNDDIVNRRVRWMNIAEGITKTCHESYESSLTKLGPEVIRFNGFFRPADRSYLLRPETVESFFILWRITKDQKYREWGWKVVQALELNCKVEAGYAGIKNVNILKSTDDVQQSFFLAETLKYLYLLFSDDDLLDLNQWVFNTEAHPLPVRGVNPLYRAHGTNSTSLNTVHMEL